MGAAIPSPPRPSRRIEGVFPTPGREKAARKRAGGACFRRFSVAAMARLQPRRMYLDQDKPGRSCRHCPPHLSSRPHSGPFPWPSPLEAISLLDEAVLHRNDVIRKQSADTIRAKRWRSVMSVILTLIYREFCTARLAEIRKLPAAR